MVYHTNFDPSKVLNITRNWILLVHHGPSRSIYYYNLWSSWSIFVGTQSLYVVPFRGQMFGFWLLQSNVNMATKTKNMLKVGMQSVKLNCWNRVQQIDGPEDSGQVKLGRHKALLWLISIQKIVFFVFFPFYIGGWHHQTRTQQLSSNRCVDACSSLSLRTSATGWTTNTWVLAR